MSDVQLFLQKDDKKHPARALFVTANLTVPFN